MVKWKKVFAAINNLWSDENATPERGVIVVTEIEETEFCDVQFGWARVGDEWYKVVCVGAGDWMASWSDRQQRFVTVADVDFTKKLNDFAGLSSSPVK